MQISTYVWPGKTHFGFGAAGLAGEEARLLNSRKVFVLVDPGIKGAGLHEPVLSSLKKSGLSVDIFDGVVPNPDTASIDAAGSAFRDSGADLVVGMGGGSSLDTAKAVRLLAFEPLHEPHIADYSPYLGDACLPVPSHLPPLIAIPSTAGTGSEATPWALVIDDKAKRKFGVGNAHTVPDVALVDPALTMGLPPDLTAATGMDALAHCIEAYVSTHQNPIVDPMILYGIELIGKSLRTATAQGQNHDARQDMMCASLIGGIAISSKWLGACHSLAHPLSGLANVPHGVAAALMLPHQMAYSLPGALERYAQLGKALDPYGKSGSLRQQAEKAVETVRELILDLGLPLHLRDVGISEEMIPKLAADAYHDSNWITNPRHISEDIMEQLYKQAF